MASEHIPSREELHEREMHAQPEPRLPSQGTMGRESLFAILAIIALSIAAIGISPLFGIVLCIIGLLLVGAFALRQQPARRS